MKYIVTGIVLLLCCFSMIYGFEIPVAEFQSISDSDQVVAINGDTFSQAVFKSLTEQDAQGLVGFKYKNRESTGGVVKSQLDAAKNCEIHGWELLVYGQIVAREYGYDVEIKIYSHPERTVIRTILVRAAMVDYETLISDCSVKLFGYFSSLLKVDAEKKPFVAESNSLITSHTLEWWGTIPPWMQTITSIVGYHGTLGFRLGAPLWTNGEWAWMQEFALGVGFHFGMSPANVVKSYLYDIDIGPNISWAFVWQRQQEIRIGIEPGVKIHVLNYVPMYDSAKTDAWVWYGGQLTVEYRFWVDTARTFGIGLEAGVASYFTNPFYLDYRVGVDFAWKGKAE